MKGDPAIVDFLNKALMAEMTAHDEYFLEGRMLSDWGFKKLAHGLWRKYAKVHHRNVRKFTDRILFLDGTPTMMPNDFKPEDSVEGMFAAALDVETKIQSLYSEAATACDDKGDFVSEDLFVGVSVKTERRILKIETQIELIGSLGLELYLQEKV